MPQPAPGAPDFAESRFVALILRTLTRLVPAWGNAITGVNYMMRRYPGATRAQAGRWVSMLGAAYRAAGEIRRAEPGDMLEFSSAPLVGGSIWGDNYGDRWLARVSMTWENPMMGRTETRTVEVTGSGDITRAELSDRAIKEATDRERSLYGDAAGIGDIIATYDFAIRRY